MQSQKYNKTIATIIIIALAIFLAVALLPFLKGILGAIILAVLFYPLHKRIKKKLPETISAGLMIILSILIVIIPLAIIITLIVGQASTIIQNPAPIQTTISQVMNHIPADIGIEEKAIELAKSAGDYLRSILIDLIGDISNSIITLVIMYFLFFYMLINANKIQTTVRELIPFNEKNKERLMKEFTNVTYSTVIVTGLIALIQAVLLGLLLFAFGIKNALLWSFIGFILAFLPLIGIPLIWIPAGIILLIQQRYLSGAGVLIGGAIISTIDNFIRPWLSKKLSEVHPLITLIGVFIGLPIFGILGLIIGPLLLSYFFLIWKMYREEYL